MILSKVSNLLANSIITTNIVATGLNPNPSIQTNKNTVLTSPDTLFQGVKNSSKMSANLNFFENTTKGLINENTRVLHIGDSHTVGVYGKEMDRLMRETGAKVQTYGSAGSSPSWWLTGHTTKSGFYSKDDNGNIDSPADWKQPHETPKFTNLINNFKPNVIVISLGANLIKANGETIEKEVKKLADIAKESGAKIIWVGPPDGRESKKPTSKQTFLYEHLEKVAKQYGTFLDSRQYTEYPEKGGDGLHYGGEQGTEIAKNWAKSIFNDIQNSE
ncbi:MAG: hypothetical protein U0354_05855 [Candidatus Sericytochromatia bacterium]